MDAEELTPLEGLTLTLFDIGAIEFGKYKLHDGSFTTVYVDLRILVSFPAVLKRLTALYHSLIRRLDLEFDLLTAPPMAGLPIATALCLEMDEPLIYPRKTAKSYGSGKAIEGVFSVGQKALVIDDVVDTGESIVQAIAALKSKGLQISDAVVFLDREHGGVELLRREGYRLFYLLTLSDMLAVLRDYDKISQKEYNKAMKPLR
jgi:uridine monophosphate synthetase